MNVLIVDDEPPARDRLHNLLDQLPDYHCCGEASNGAEALRLAESAPPENKEILNLSETAELFDLNKIGKKDAVFDYEKLEWMNSKYIMNADSEKLYEYIIKEYDSNIFSNHSKE